MYEITRDRILDVVTWASLPLQSLKHKGREELPQFETEKGVLNGHLTRARRQK